MSTGKSFIKNVTFYKDYPTLTNISLVQIERLVIERLNILQTFANYNEMRQNFEKEWAELMSKALANVETDLILNDLANDHLSHWFLLLIMCSSRTDQIIIREGEFFAWKLASLSIEQAKELLKTLPLPIQEIADSDRANLPVFCDENATIYRIKFNHVKNLVSSINAFLYLGYAYVADKFLTSILCEYFTEILVQRIEHLKEIRTNLNDNRVYFLENIVKSKFFTNVDSFNVLGQLSIVNIPEVARLFPLCMRMLYKIMKEKHFLNHFQRRQFLMFLRTIGLDINICHDFFFTEFTKRITPVQYQQKCYKYEIDYCYGVVGNRIWSAFDCSRIINETKQISTESTCGDCPFVTKNEELLKSILKTTELGVTDIEDLVKVNACTEPQTVCGQVFEKLYHKRISRIKHPNQYFKESYQIKH